MKFLKRENLLKKVIIAILVVLCTNFSMPTVSRAGVSEAIGDFLLILPDGVMWLLQSQFLDDGPATITAYSEKKEDGEEISTGWMIIGGAIGGPVVLLLQNGYNYFFADGEFELPTISYTPYNIFANNIPLLNADFFGEGKNLTKTYWISSAGNLMNNGISEMKAETRDELEKMLIAELKDIGITEDTADLVWGSDNAWMYWDDKIAEYLNNKNKKDDINEEFEKWVTYGVFEKKRNDVKFTEIIEEMLTGGYDTVGINDIIAAEEIKDVNYDNLPDEIKYQKFDDIIREYESTHFKEYTSTKHSSVSILKPIISKWYNILRTVAMVGLLSVLVYIGIRILIYSTSAQDKAKYKNMLKDWVIGLCLLFVLHFIMSFTMAVTGYIRDIFTGSDMESSLIKIFNDTEYAGDDSLEEASFNKHLYKDEKGNVFWKANSVERIRYLICATNVEESFALRLGYTIMYIIVIIEVLVFTFQYLKRVITMAILTLISPLVALTYPIDKITDGKAQGFNMWLKEYIFNALLQPMHLILYTIIMSSALVLVETNPIYGIVALACMTTMEKLLRKIFGFNKADTVGVFGGAAGAAVVMSTMSSLRNLGKKSSMRYGKEKDDGLKLWSNKHSIDSEELLLGSPEGTNSNAISGNEEGDNTEPENPGNIHGSENGKGSNTKPQNPGFIPSSGNEQGNNTKPPEYYRYIPREVTPQKEENQKSNVPEQTPIRQMPSSRRVSAKKRAIKNPRLYALGQMGKTYGKKLTRELKHTPGTLLRGAAKIAGAATVGTVGLAAGIVSGDLGKTLQYASTAGIAGASLAGSLANTTTNSVNNLKDTYRSSYASVDEDYATKKRIKEFKNNEQNMNYIQSRYVSTQEQKEVMNTMENAAEYGITDVQDVSAIYEMQKQKGLNIEQAIAVSKMSKKLGDIGQPKVRKEWKEHFESKGYSNAQINELFNRVEKYQKERD